MAAFLQTAPARRLFLTFQLLPGSGHTGLAPVSPHGPWQCWLLAVVGPDAFPLVGSLLALIGAVSDSAPSMPPVLLGLL